MLYSICALIVFGLFIGLSFWINDYLPVNGSKISFYVTIKVLCCVIFVVALPYMIFSKRDAKGSMLQVVLTAIIQFLPFGVRLVIVKTNLSLTIPVILSCLTLLLYFLLFFGFELLNDKEKNKLEG